MCELLAHRGPDSEGLWSEGLLTFGHRRLAIFDLSAAGNQPMSTTDGRLVVAFNGAVYNFRELRSELERRGAVFRSHSDTEVLLHGYRAWGIHELVRRLRGMFAFALWDKEAQSLALVRDRLGVKPLVYAELGGVLLFASTVRALRATGLVTQTDPHGVTEFLEQGYVPDFGCIYEGVRKLPGGVHWFVEASKSMEITRYWEPAATRE
ncbi:MAG: hypothetical protein U0163_04620 [Gemmatimonadaceae bacterium]